MPEWLVHVGDLFQPCLLLLLRFGGYGSAAVEVPDDDIIGQIVVCSLLRVSYLTLRPGGFLLMTCRCRLAIRRGLSICDLLGTGCYRLVAGCGLNRRRPERRLLIHVLLLDECIDAERVRGMPVGYGCPTEREKDGDDTRSDCGDGVAMCAGDAERAECGFGFGRIVHRGGVGAFASVPRGRRSHRRLSPVALALFADTPFSGGVFLGART
jgi:hypothetical protein